MLPDDLPAVVRVHQLAFRGFFLDRMGPAFLRGYYRAVLDWTGAIALVAQTSAGVQGFAVGFADPDGFYRHFRARRRRLIPAILLALIRRPSLLADILRNARRVEVAQGAEPGVVELSSIATAAPGRGIGAVLVQAFCAEAFGQGAVAVALTTDRDDNGVVRDFYERHGFKHVGHESRGERVLCCYRLARP
ncbi:GCN5-related N-acetyltransferase [Rhodobacter ferrooxidans]|uniref:GCN5-related N-acetyltransferase n=2 Tax=Rhodobacter ferrooxidans TaxID=371731 RepID=C8S567_9RHOB|nr:GCN5-related N-acetyltransferase [Rhodobacter sp. SW2]